MTKGDKLIRREQIDDEAILEYVLNPAGVPYALLIVNGEELLSCEEKSANNMVAHYKEMKRKGEI